LSITAIIVAAGSSRRMGFDKLFAPLHGQAVVGHSIAAFQQCEEVDEIILVSQPERHEALQELVAERGYDKVVRVIAGGAERHLSVWQGLQAVDPAAEFVAIHDGARPLIQPELITRCIALARLEGAACCAVPVADTLKRASADQKVIGSVDRSHLWAMQTPQIFATALIVQAYAQIIAVGELVTDEVSAVQQLGKEIALLANDEWNFKITFPADLTLAEQVLRWRATEPVSPPR
jgi:2-C-methyl-D-erythritol 4-phosphate cytidylyltransferase